MIAHGIVSGALFFCIGIIYERYATTFIWYYGGVAFILPVYSIFFLIFTLANISFPTSSNFIGEMLLFLGIFRDNFILGTVASLSMFWGAIYSVWTYNRICFGNIKTFSLKPFKAYDIDKQDFNILFLLVFLLMLTGIYSSSILDYITINTTIIINRAVNIIEQTSLIIN
jgi:NADH-quinone oxidoreductase subunit M